MDRAECKFSGEKHGSQIERRTGVSNARRPMTRGQSGFDSLPSLPFPMPAMLRIASAARRPPILVHR